MTITASPEQVSAAITIGGLVMLSSLGANIALMIGLGKRKPNIDQTLQAYATRNELNDLRSGLSAQCASKHVSVDNSIGLLFDLDRKRAEALSQWQTGVASQLGRIESSVEDIKKKL